MEEIRVRRNTREGWLESKIEGMNNTRDVALG